MIEGKRVIAWLRKHQEITLGFCEEYTQTCAIGAYINRDGGKRRVGFGVVSDGSDDYDGEPLDEVATRIQAVFDRMPGYEHPAWKFLEVWDATH